MNKVTNILKGRRFARDQAAALIDITEEVMRIRPCVIMVANGPQTWLALPAAATALFGAPVLDWCVALPEKVSEVRLTASVTAAGPPNGVLSLWVTSGGAAGSFASYALADGAIIPLDATRFADSGWWTLPMSVTGGQRFAAVVGSDGDGIVDAEFSQLSIWAR